MSALSSTKNKYESHEKACKNKKFCNIQTLHERNIILEFVQYLKHIKMPCIIDAYTESLLRKMLADKDNPEKSSTTKVSKQNARDYSRFTMYSFDNEKISMVNIEVKAA